MKMYRKIALALIGTVWTTSVQAIPIDSYISEKVYIDQVVKNEQQLDQGIINDHQVTTPNSLVPITENQIQFIVPMMEWPFLNDVKYREYTSGGEYRYESFDYWENTTVNQLENGFELTIDNVDWTLADIFYITIQVGDTCYDLEITKSMAAKPINLAECRTYPITWEALDDIGSKLSTMHLYKIDENGMERSIHIDPSRLSGAAITGGEYDVYIHAKQGVENYIFKSPLVNGEITKGIKDLETITVHNGDSLDTTISSISFSHDQIPYAYIDQVEETCVIYTDKTTHSNFNIYTQKKDSVDTNTYCISKIFDTTIQPQEIYVDTNFSAYLNLEDPVLNAGTELILDYESGYNEGNTYEIRDGYGNKIDNLYDDGGIGVLELEKDGQVITSTIVGEDINSTVTLLLPEQVGEYTLRLRFNEELGIQPAVADLTITDQIPVPEDNIGFFIPMNERPNYIEVRYRNYSDSDSYYYSSVISDYNPQVDAINGGYQLHLPQVLDWTQSDLYYVDIQVGNRHYTKEVTQDLLGQLVNLEEEVMYEMTPFPYQADRGNIEYAYFLGIDENGQILNTYTPTNPSEPIYLSPGEYRCHITAKDSNYHYIIASAVTNGVLDITAQDMELINITHYPTNPYEYINEVIADLRVNEDIGIGDYIGININQLNQVQLYTNKTNDMSLTTTINYSDHSNYGGYILEKQLDLANGPVVVESDLNLTGELLLPPTLKLTDEFRDFRFEDTAYITDTYGNQFVGFAGMSDSVGKLVFEQDGVIVCENELDYEGDVLGYRIPQEVGEYTAKVELKPEFALPTFEQKVKVIDREELGPNDIGFIVEGDEWPTLQGVKYREYNSPDEYTYEFAYYDSKTNPLVEGFELIITDVDWTLADVFYITIQVGNRYYDLEVSADIAKQPINLASYATYPIAWVGLDNVSDKLANMYLKDIDENGIERDLPVYISQSNGVISITGGEYSAYVHVKQNLDHYIFNTSLIDGEVLKNVNDLESITVHNGDPSKTSINNIQFWNEHISHADIYDIEGGCTIYTDKDSATQMFIYIRNKDDISDGNYCITKVVDNTVQPQEIYVDTNFSGHINLENTVLNAGGKLTLHWGPYIEGNTYEIRDSYGNRIDNFYNQQTIGVLEVEADGQIIASTTVGENGDSTAELILPKQEGDYILRLRFNEELGIQAATADISIIGQIPVPEDNIGFFVPGDEQPSRVEVRYREYWDSENYNYTSVINDYSPVAESINGGYQLQLTEVLDWTQSDLYYVDIHVGNRLYTKEVTQDMLGQLVDLGEEVSYEISPFPYQSSGGSMNSIQFDGIDENGVSTNYFSPNNYNEPIYLASGQYKVTISAKDNSYHYAIVSQVVNGVLEITAQDMELINITHNTENAYEYINEVTVNALIDEVSGRRSYINIPVAQSNEVQVYANKTNHMFVTSTINHTEGNNYGGYRLEKETTLNNGPIVMETDLNLAGELLLPEVLKLTDQNRNFIFNENTNITDTYGNQLVGVDGISGNIGKLIFEQDGIVVCENDIEYIDIYDYQIPQVAGEYTAKVEFNSQLSVPTITQDVKVIDREELGPNDIALFIPTSNDTVNVYQMAWKQYMGWDNQEYIYNGCWFNSEVYPVQNGVEVIIREIDFMEDLLKVSLRDGDTWMIVELTPDMKGTTVEIEPPVNTMPMKVELEYFEAGGQIDYIEVYQLDQDGAAFPVTIMSDTELMQVPHGEYLIRITAHDQSGYYENFVRTQDGQVTITQDQLRTIQFNNHQLQPDVNVDFISILPRNRALYPLYSFNQWNGFGDRVFDNVKLYTNVWEDIDVKLGVQDIEDRYTYAFLSTIESISSQGEVIDYSMEFTSELNLIPDKVMPGDNILIDKWNDISLTDTYGNRVTHFDTEDSLGKIILTQDGEIVQEEVVYGDKITVKVPLVEGDYELIIQFNNQLNISDAHAAIKVTNNIIGDDEVGFLIPTQEEVQGRVQLDLYRRQRNENGEYYYNGIWKQWDTQQTPQGTLVILRLEDWSQNYDYVGGLIVNEILYELDFSIQDKGNIITLDAEQKTFPLDIELPYFGTNGTIQNVIVNKVDDQNNVYEVGYKFGDSLNIPEGRYVAQITAQDDEGYYVIYKELEQGKATITQDELQYAMIDYRQQDQDLVFSYLHAAPDKTDEYNFNSTWRLMLQGNPTQVKVYTNKSNNADFIMGIESTKDKDNYTIRLENVRLVEEPLYGEFDTNFTSELVLDNTKVRPEQQIEVGLWRQLKVRDSYGNRVTRIESPNDSIGDIIFEHTDGTRYTQKIGQHLNTMYFDAPKQEGKYTLTFDFNEPNKVPDTSAQIHVSGNLEENQVGFSIPQGGYVQSWKVTYKEGSNNDYWYNTYWAHVDIQHHKDQTEFVIHNVDWNRAEEMIFSVSVDGRSYAIPFGAQDRGKMVQVNDEEIYQDLTFNLPYLEQGGEILSLNINRFDENGQSYNMGGISSLDRLSKIQLPQGAYIIQVNGFLDGEYYVTYTEVTDGVINVSSDELGEVHIQNTDTDSGVEITNVFLIPSQEDQLPIRSYHGLGGSVSGKEVVVHTNKVDNIQVTTQIANQSTGVRYELTSNKNWATGDILQQRVNTQFNTQLHLKQNSVSPDSEILVRENREIIIQDSYRNFLTWIDTNYNRSELDDESNIYTLEDDSRNIITKLVDENLCEVSFTKNGIEENATILNDYPWILVRAPKEMGQYVMKVSFAEETHIPQGTTEINVGAPVLQPGIYEENAIGFKYAGSWIDTPVVGASEGKVKASDIKGDTVSFSFDGSGFIWSALNNGWRGKARVSVDGVEVGVVDQYSPNTEMQESIRVEGLGQGTHEVVIEVLGQKHPSSQSSKVTMDRIEILEHPLALQQGIYEEDAEGLNYQGTWVDTPVSGSSKGKVKASEVKGDTLSFNFEGTGFVWNALNNGWRGKAKVSVDGIEVGVVDQYSPTAENKESIRVEGLDYGVHKVVIEVLGEKNPNSQSNKVTIDTLEILNKKSNNANLSNLEVNHGILKPNFTPNQQTYNVQVGEEVEEILITAKAAHKKAKIEGAGSKVLKLGDNHFEIKVTAEDGTHKIYTLVVTRQQNVVLEEGMYEENAQGLNYQGAWVDTAVSGSSGGKVKAGEVKGDTLTFKFEGTGFVWHALNNDWRGKARVSVDGVEVGIVDQYSPTVEMKETIRVEGLDYGTHEVVIEVLGEKHTNSQSVKVTIDVIEILSKHEVLQEGIYEEHATGLSYKGQWIDTAVPGSSGGKVKASEVKGDTLSFSFEGTGFVWKSMNNDWRGKAKVSIDGVEVGIVDQYSAVPKVQENIRVDDLEYGEHDVTIEVLGEKHANSHSVKVTVDTIEVLGAKPTVVLKPGSYEEAAEGLVYTGNWGHFTKDIASGGEVAFSGEKGATLEFVMQGTEFIWFGHVNEWRGTAKIYVDGKEVGIMNQYIKPGQGSGSIHPEYIGTFKVGGLTPGQHKVKIEVLGEKLVGAQDTKVTIDKLIIK